VLHQEKQQLHGDGLQLQRGSGRAQLVGAHVQLEIVSESERARR